MKVDICTLSVSAVLRAVGLFAAPCLLADTHYASLTGGHNPPFTNWIDAATNIRHAVSAATTGDDVAIGNGVWQLDATIEMDSDIQLRGQSGPANCILLAPTNSSAVRRCIRASGGRIEGFTLAQGSVSGEGGGGLAGQDLFVDNCVFQGNSVRASWTAIGFGGGAHCVDSVITDCTFKGNRGFGALHGPDSRGAGLAAFGCMVEDCEFYGNDADSGAALYANNSTIADCVVTGNVSRNDGAVLAEFSTLANCLISDNMSGGGIHLVGGTICASQILRNQTLLWDPDIFIGDPPDTRGGGLQLQNGAIAERCRVEGNEAFVGGGAYLSSGSTLRNCLIVSNAAKLSGPSGGSTSPEGGGVFIEGMGVLESCTVVNNVGLDGAIAGLAWDPGFTAPSDTEIRNNILYDNGPMNADTSLTNATILHNCIEFWPEMTNGNITVEPQFADTNRFRLAVRSPCVDIGTNLSWHAMGRDYCGHPRVFNGVVDMGMAELTPSATIFAMARSNGVLTNWFSGLPGATYQLFSAGDVAATVWSPVGPPLVATGTVAQVGVSVESSTSMFYRVESLAWP